MFIATQLILGAILLYAGAEGLVKGSSSLALRWRLTPLFVGLTIVAFGTSMPELMVSTEAAVRHYGTISVGNIVGSNIFNITVILGISALVRPLKIKRQLIIIDMPLMIGVSVLFIILFLDHQFSRIEGACFFIGIVLYTIFSYNYARREAQKGIDLPTGQAGMIETDLIPKPTRNLLIDIIFIIGGFICLIEGSHVFVSGSIQMARILDVSEAVIALTIVSFGTSLPELATSVVAVFRKKADIAIGNIIGSNIFNILCVIGFASLIQPIDGTGISTVDTLVMLGTAIVLLPLMRTDFTLKRLEGVLLLVSYIVYIYYLLSK